MSVHASHDSFAKYNATEARDHLKLMRVEIFKQQKYAGILQTPEINCCLFSSGHGMSLKRYFEEDAVREIEFYHHVDSQITQRDLTTR